MPKLRRLSGREAIAVLKLFGFTETAQRGSHVKLKRVVAESSQVLTVPIHTSLDPGTLRAIIRQASKFIPEGDLRKHFYSD